MINTIPMVARRSRVLFVMPQTCAAAALLPVRVTADLGRVGTYANHNYSTKQGSPPRGILR